MKKVLLVMRRKVLSEALLQRKNAKNTLTLYSESHLENVLLSIEGYQVDTVVIELPENSPLKMQAFLQLVDDIRDSYPHCKILLLCSEYSDELKELVIDEKQNGKIDDFLFFDTSVEYLMSKLESM